MKSTHRIFLPLLIATGTLVAATGVSAQYTGPSDKPENNTAKDVLDNGRDDQNVQLTGRITKQLGDEDYTFADDSGEIQVEIDDDDAAFDGDLSAPEVVHTIKPMTRASTATPTPPATIRRRQ